MEEKSIIQEVSETPRIRKTQSCWYAVYTHSRAEKKVNDRLARSGVETLLPLQKTLRQWSDRKKLIEKPLISSYVFVKVVPREFAKVIKTEGVVKIIMMEGKPVVIPEEQIMNLRILCGSDANVLVTENVFLKGDLVEVVYGSLTGLRGELVRVGKKQKVVIRILEPGMNLTVDIKSIAIRKIEKVKRNLIKTTSQSRRIS